MFFEIARILKVKRPKIVFLENVKGLLNHDKGETFKVIIQTLSELGYDVQWMVLNSKFFGVPQNRERVFIIGSLRGEPRPEILPFRQDDQEFIREENSTGQSNAITATYWKGNKGTMINRIQSDISGKGYNSQQDRIYLTNGVMFPLPHANPDSKLNIAIPVLTPDREEKRQNGRRFKTDVHGVMVLDDYNHKIKSDNIVGAVRQTFNNSKEGNGIKLIDGMKIRRLTPTECLRLQGFPDNWFDGLNLSDTQRYKMMGNAVTVNVIQVIADKLLKNL
jgi:DNA (cytosine-5)-methyltransferase 1